MAVLSLPVDPRELSLSLERRRSPQESAFTGAVQHVVGAGALWRGYIDLPPILDRATWAEVREVVRKVMSGSDRLRVPVVDGAYTYPFTAHVSSDFRQVTPEDLCAIDVRATLHLSGTRLLLHRPSLHAIANPNFIFGIDWPADLSSGIYVTALWHDGTETVTRAALTHAERLEHNVGLTTSATLTATDTTELRTIDLLDESDISELYGPDDVVFGFGGFDVLRLSPAVPQMFRAATATTAGNWCTVQAQFCEPYLPALIANEDALGHTIRDRAVLPNRIEVVSSTVWP